MSFAKPASRGATGQGGALRVGVIGAGIMGSNHGRVLAGLPNVELVGIVDPLPEHRTRAIALIGCPTFTDLDGLLAAGVDAVTIAAPTHLHHDISLYILVSTLINNQNILYWPYFDGKFAYLNHEMLYSL